VRLVSRNANDVYEIGNKIREAREAQGNAILKVDTERPKNDGRESK
jgi:hypothetical protein